MLEWMNDMEQTEEYRVLIKGGEGQIIEKKSRFIATIRKCESEEEAAAFLEEIKKKYWDARHVCSAYVIGSRGELTRCSDDGEPAGTAGRPMLEVLLGEGIRNIAVTVTRYFGGTLLGTGGLVRAYSRAVREGLAHCETGRMCYGHELRITTDYNGIGKILYFLGQRGIEPMESIYGEKVCLRVMIPAAEEEVFSGGLVEATGGRVLIEKVDSRFFVV